MIQRYSRPAMQATCGQQRELEILADPEVAKLISQAELDNICSLDCHFKHVKPRFKKLGL